MSDYMDELNRLMERFAANPDVVATALTGRLGEVLILSGQCEGYTQDDEWSRGFELRLGTASRRGGLVERQSTLTNARITFLFGDPDWFFADPPPAEVSEMVRIGLYKVHDPRGLIDALLTKSGAEPIEFADTSEIAAFADISCDFFRLVGLGNALFISNESTLNDWCDASGVALKYANARIQEIYGVDVADLNGGRLTAIFQRIKQRGYYREL